MRVHLKSFGPGGDRRATQAFTITELLVVIAIIVLLIAIAVPAFSSLMESSERNLTENQFKAAIASARDAARQSGSADAAAVIIYTLNPGGGGHITIVPCIVAGQLEDVIDPALSRTLSSNLVMRDVLVPIPTMQPTQLMRGWSIRGFAPPQTMYDGNTGSEPWYEVYDSATSGQGRARTHRDGNWLFPESAFYVPTVGTGGASAGTSRQSFMIRFKAGTGQLDVGNTRTALFFDPAPSGDPRSARFRSARPYADCRADQLRLQDKIAPDAATWVRRVLTRTDFGSATNPADMNRQLLLGDECVDTVLVRPVTELALYQEQTMAAAIGAASLNRFTGTIYADQAGDVPPRPIIDTTLFGAGAPSPDTVCDRVDEWIFGRYAPSAGGAPVASDARIFTIEPYLGQVQELVP
jgi:type II secretory pathway pseudopilin PulG